MQDTPDVAIGKLLVEYLSDILPAFTIRRAYADVRDFLDEEALSAPEAVLVLEGMEETPATQRGVMQDFRFTLGLFAPIAGATEADLTAGMDAAMHWTYDLADAFYQKSLVSSTLGSVKLLSVDRVGGAMYDADLFRLYHLYACDFSLVVRYFREVPR